MPVSLSAWLTFGSWAGVSSPDRWEVLETLTGRHCKEQPAGARLGGGTKCLLFRELLWSAGGPLATLQRALFST